MRVLMSAGCRAKVPLMSLHMQVKAHSAPDVDVIMAEVAIYAAILMQSRYWHPRNTSAKYLDFPTLLCQHDCCYCTDGPTARYNSRSARHNGN